MHTNFVVTIMRIEDVIKSNGTLPLNQRTVMNILYTQNVVAEKFNEIIKPYDISAEQFNVLRILRGQKGKPANMCVIQERMISRTSNTTRLVDKLLNKELVTREVCSVNRRKMDIAITNKGLDLLKELDPQIEEHDNLFSKNLNTEELKQLNDLLEKYRG
mgnify:CR=1 FL=1